MALRLIELSRSEDVSIGEVADLLQQDPALAARVLRYANSAAVGVRHPVTSIGRAATLLGLVTLQTVSLSFSLITSLQRDSVLGFDHKRYWRRSLYCAAASQAIGAVLATPGRDGLFIAGLLQDVGVLVLAHALGDTYTDVARQAGPLHEDLIAAERRAFGFDHSAVTAWIAHEWKLPALFIEAAESSHGDRVGYAPQAEESIVGPVGPTVALASHVADIFCTDDVANASTRAEVAARLSFSMSREQFTEALGRTGEYAADGAALLELDIGSNTENSRILEDARDSLIELTVRSGVERQALVTTSQRDGLTGLWNRPHLDRALDDRFDEASRSGRPLTIAFCDIDHFKKVNDTYGHLVGDRVIKHVANLLVSASGESALVGRYGGEEFVVALSDTTKTDAARVIAGVCESIAASRVVLDDGRVVRVTISIGLGTSGCKPGETVAALLSVADKALYAAKRSGRNRVCEG